MYGCESWTIKKPEHQRIDAFELWCWKRLLIAPWTARRCNQWILKEISPEYSLEGLMLKLKLQCFGLLMRRTHSLVAQMVKCLPAMQETLVQSLGWEDPLEKEMATHSSTLAWKIPWMEKPGGLQSMALQRVRHDWATSLSFFSFDGGKDWRQEEKGTTEDAMVGWHHQLYGHEFE